MSVGSNKRRWRRPSTSVVRWMTLARYHSAVPIRTAAGQGTQADHGYAPVPATKEDQQDTLADVF